RKRGHYAMLVTDGEPQAVEALEQAIRLDERIMRFLTTRLTELSDEPSPLVRRRSTPAAQEEEPATEVAAEASETPAAEVAAEASEAPAAEVAAEASEAPAAKKVKAKPAETSGEEASS
ncbi:MAG: 30S ribosomal protein S6, partial [Mariprofundaceae bacterium]|nr:30S ribosomal protein S6 [Mariprofundaceae bacterium]